MKTISRRDFIKLAGIVPVLVACGTSIFPSEVELVKMACADIAGQKMIFGQVMQKYNLPLEKVLVILYADDSGKEPGQIIKLMNLVDGKTKFTEIMCLAKA